MVRVCYSSDAYHHQPDLIISYSMKKSNTPADTIDPNITGLSGLSLKYLSHSALNSGPISFNSSSVGRIYVTMKKKEREGLSDFKPRTMSFVF